MLLRRKLTIELFLTCLLLIGCRQVAPKSELLRAGEPLEPLAKTNSDVGCDSEDRAATNAPVAELVLNYLRIGRDFYEPSGNDGYVLRVIPLNADYCPVRLTGGVRMSLQSVLPQNNNDNSQVLMQWQASGRLLQDYWMPGRLLDGYLFRLSWSDRQPPPGDYKITVEIEYYVNDAMQRLCQEIFIQG